MRITNKIIQNNNLTNINTNKVYQDKLSTQMSTQKKVSRPSDDPVVAIRALRLRSSVTEITQYYSKNIPDANSWLDVTEDALNNLTSIVTDMISQCTKGSNGDLTLSDRQIILEQLQALGDEVYSTANADYAGRYVFAGYRTDTPICFTSDSTDNYSITEQISSSSIDEVTHISTGSLLDINASNYANFAGVDETSISSVSVHRIRLAYDDCNADTVPVIKYTQRNDDGTLTDPDAEKPDGVIPNDQYDIETIYSYGTSADGTDPYTYVSENDDAVVYVPDTGELLLGKDVYDKLMATKDDPITKFDESEIQVTYEKNSWSSGDLRPEHYYYCTNKSTGVEYNEDYITGQAETQAIEYDVGFNQTIRVNSTAGECFKTGIGREVNDLINSIQEYMNIEVVKNNIETKLTDENLTDDETEILNTQLEAAEKAYTLAKDKCQRAFEGGITAFQGYLDDANLCITDTGTRSKKLELIENRMQNQKTTFETLKSENEDIDITEVAIQLSSAELTYEAALMATGKVMQSTLLNYI
jgi:flagellar hook-associated protein 3 FlgL